MYKFFKNELFKKKCIKKTYPAMKSITKILFPSSNSETHRINYDHPSESLLKKYKNYIDWSKVNYSLLSNEFILEHKKYINFNDERIYKTFYNPNHLRILKDSVCWKYVNWYAVLEQGHLDNTDMVEFFYSIKDYIKINDKDQYRYSIIPLYADRDIKLIREFRYCIDWENYNLYTSHTMKYKLPSEEFLEEFFEYINWESLWDLVSEGYTNHKECGDRIDFDTTVLNKYKRYLSPFPEPCTCSSCTSKL